MIVIVANVFSTGFIGTNIGMYKKREKTIKYLQFYFSPLYTKYERFILSFYFTFFGEDDGVNYEVPNIIINFTD